MKDEICAPCGWDGQVDDDRFASIGHGVCAPSSGGLDSGETGQRRACSPWCVALDGPAGGAVAAKSCAKFQLNPSALKNVDRHQLQSCVCVRGRRGDSHGGPMVLVRMGEPARSWWCAPCTTGYTAGALIGSLRESSRELRRPAREPGGARARFLPRLGDPSPSWQPPSPGADSISHGQVGGPWVSFDDERLPAGKRPYAQIACSRGSASADRREWTCASWGPTAMCNNRSDGS